MKSMTSKRLALIGACAVTLVGCTHSVPPELASARDTCGRSMVGPAAKLVPAELHKAKVALSQAEKSFSDEPEAYETRDLAYVAWRKCEIADALAGVASDKAKTVSAKENFSTIQGEIVEQTKADLAQTQANLDQTQAALMAALAKLAEVKEEERGLVITLSGSVLFQSDEVTLLPEAQIRLDQVAEALLAGGQRSLVVEGHTDSQGSDEHNRDLSQRRAEAVRSYLIRRGYPGERIVAQGMGEQRPIADNATPEGLSNNRRVEIIIQREMPPQSAN